mgnify:CR=1 FL=1|tara:strand:+ start:157 stop:432 length:276 start_codon:yes stop_codon:yes gene_type:complete
MKYINILGYLGGFFLTINMIPQIYKTYREKRADNISLLFLLLNFIGLFLNMTYSYLDKIYAIAIPISFSFFFCCIMIVLKLKYKNNTILPD